MYLPGIPDWVFWWGLVALILALLLLACDLFVMRNAPNQTWRKQFKCFFYSLACFLPCLGCPLFCFDVFIKKKCKLCGKRIWWGIEEHRTRCRERDPAYGEIPDSPLYHCKNCNTHLKIWPVEKVESMDCFGPECAEQVKNNGGNIHLCFICNRMVCPKHTRNLDERILIDFSSPASVPSPIDRRTSEILNENRASPTNTSEHRVVLMGMALALALEERRRGLNPHNSPNVNTNNLTTLQPYNPQPSDDLFPDLPPSYEVAMMEEIPAQ